MGWGSARPIVLWVVAWSLRNRSPLKAVRTAPKEPDYQALLGWSFAAQPFYEGQVLRLLQSDIPHRVMYSAGLVWVYRDPAGNTVGFGTLDVCGEYGRFADGKDHLYIPLLAVSPAFQRRGHGRSIVNHLIAEATRIAQSQGSLSDLLFLDVYTANQGAISLYGTCGFVTLSPDAPILDPQENNETYIIMARSLAGALGVDDALASPTDAERQGR